MLYFAHDEASKLKERMMHMRAEVKIQENCPEPYAVIYANEITQEVQRVLNFMRDSSATIVGKDEDRMYMLRPEEIFMVNVEGERTFLHTKNKRFSSSKRLYEMKECLGADFVQISKSSIVRISACESVEVAFNGMMLLHLKNGGKEYVSRHYLPEFKKSLGL